MDTNSTAAIYVRISADPEGQRAGVERQRTDCEAEAKRLGLEVVGIYEDNDVSAYSGRVRPAFEELLADAAAGEFAHVIVWASDRLFRQSRELVRISDDLAPYAQIHQMGGEIDLTTATGILNAQIGGSLAEFESRRKAERITARAKQRAEVDLRMTASTLPTGWAWADPCPAGEDCHHAKRCTAPGQRARQGSRAGVKVDVSESLIVADAYRQVANGATLRCAWMHARDAGLDLSCATSLRGVLLNPRNAGLVTHRGKIVGQAADGQAIIDRSTFDTVTAILTDPSRRTSPGRPAGVPLGGGLLVCGKCGGPMAAGGRKAAEAVYVCSRERHLTRRRARIDGPALDLIGETLAGLADAGLLSLPEPEDDRGDALRTEIGVLETRRDELASLVASGALAPADFASATAKITTTMDALTARLTRRTRRPLLASLAHDKDGPRAAYEALRASSDVAPLRALLGELLDAITAEKDGALRFHWKPWVPDEPTETLRVGIVLQDRDERRLKVAKLHGEGLNISAISRAIDCQRSTVRKDLRAMAS